MEKINLSILAAWWSAAVALGSITTSTMC